MSDVEEIVGIDGTYALCDAQPPAQPNGLFSSRSRSISTCETTSRGRSWTKSPSSKR